MKRHGFTLPEVLVSLAILGLILLALGQYVTGSVRNYRQTTTMLERVQLESTARNVVVRELSFAGYGRGFIGGFSGPTIEIGLADREDRSDTFRVHYLEERWLAEPVQRQITFDVARDGNGLWNLYRREQGATRQPAVQEITNLKLVGLVTTDGQVLSQHEPWPAEIKAFVVKLSFSWETSRLAYITFTAPQQLGAL